MTALETAKSLAPGAILVLQRTSIRVSAGLKCHLLAPDASEWCKQWGPIALHVISEANVCPKGYWTTRGLPTRGLVNSRTRQLVYWTSRGQVADWTTRGCHRRLCVLSFPFWRYLRDRELSSPLLVQSTSWLVCELSSPRVDQSARCPVHELAIRKLAYPRVVQLPSKRW